MDTVSDVDKTQARFRDTLPSYLKRDYDAACSWALCGGHEEKEQDWSAAVTTDTY